MGNIFVILQEPAFNLSFTASPTTTASPSIQAATQVGVAFGASMIGMVMMMPDLNFQESVNPGGSVSAGTPGGGGLPTDASIPTLSLSLALVPIGLSDVAVLPPFARCVKEFGHSWASLSIFVVFPGAKKIFDKRRLL